MNLEKSSFQILSNTAFSGMVKRCDADLNLMLGSSRPEICLKDLGELCQEGDELDLL